MKTIKIIELLNKIANGEDVPEKIKYAERIYEFDQKNQSYIYCDGNTIDILMLHIFEIDLNDEIEIIEDNEKDEKKIEKLPLKTPCILPNRTDTEISHIPDNLELTVKINEIIDYINREK